MLLNVRPIEFPRKNRHLAAQLKSPIDKGRWLLSALFIAASLSGCGGSWNYSGPEIDVYAGPKLDNSRLAILDHGRWCWYCVDRIEIEDTNELIYKANFELMYRRDSTRSAGPNKIRILPGTYKVWLHKRPLYAMRKGHAFGEVELKAGHKYLVEFDSTFDGRTTTVWMEDAKSGEVLIGFDDPIEKELFEKQEARIRRGEELSKRKDLLLKLAEDGDVDAEYRLGFVDDVDKQWKWLCLAANKGSIFAQAEIGKRFRHGHEPFPEDRVFSLKWFSIAARNGDQWAKERAGDLKEIMSAKDISLAGRIAQEWRPDKAVCEGKPGSVI